MQFKRIEVSSNNCKFDIHRREEEIATLSCPGTILGIP